jgi:hypothetical protein
MSELIREAGQAVDLIERVGHLSPFAFTLLITALLALLCFLLVRLTLKLYVRLGDAKAMLVAHYVQYKAEWQSMKLSAS